MHAFQKLVMRLRVIVNDQYSVMTAFLKLCPQCLFQHIGGKVYA